MRLPDPLSHSLVQRLDHIRDIPAPHGLCGPGYLKALPLENIFQPIQWQVIGELAVTMKARSPGPAKPFSLAVSALAATSICGFSPARTRSA
jgi:hypothetical protein